MKKDKQKRKNPPDPKIGQRIGELRRNLKLTQEELAEKMEVSVKHVSSVERGVSACSLGALAKAALALNCSIDYLVYGLDSRSYLYAFPPAVIDILASNNEKEILLLIDYLSIYIRLRHPESD